MNVGELTTRTTLFNLKKSNEACSQKTQIKQTFHTISRGRQGLEAILTVFLGIHEPQGYKLLTDPWDALL